ncbi:MAG: BadM/Rrf2 family transcriptional regulator [Thiomicrospira sp.]|nr:MAG: BadM/Rrf2 family transcriptional regulator [Thiomicrospira sp.]
MQLTKYTDYALRVLMYLAMQDEPDTKIQIKTISEKFDIPKNHLIKVVHQLGKEGMIRTIRGKNGGIILCKAPSEILVGQVVRKFEMTLNPVNCEKPLCQIQEICLLKPALFKAMEAFLATLDQYTLADITKNQQCLKNCLLSQNS